MQRILTEKIYMKISIFFQTLLFNQNGRIKPKKYFIDNYESNIYSLVESVQQLFYAKNMNILFNFNV